MSCWARQALEQRKEGLGRRRCRSGPAGMQVPYVHPGESAAEHAGPLFPCACCRGRVGATQTDLSAQRGLQVAGGIGKRWKTGHKQAWWTAEYVELTLREARATFRLERQRGLILKCDSGRFTRAQSPRRVGVVVRVSPPPPHHCTRHLGCLFVLHFSPRVIFTFYFIF